MASQETWGKLKYFKPDGVDNFGDADAICDDLLLRLDDFREFLGCPIYVTSGVRDAKSSDKSYHSRGRGACALDVVMPECKLHPIDLVFSAMRFGFTGIGYYPDWKWNNIPCGGLHLDTRPLGIDADGTKNYSHSLWMGIKVQQNSSDGKRVEKQIYTSLTYANLLKHIRGEIHGQLT
jgi:hypothetical protein